MNTPLMASVLAASLTILPALAEDTRTLSLAPAGLSYAPEVLLPGAAGGAADAMLNLDGAKVAPRFGQAKSKWWTVGAGVAYDFTNATDLNLFGSFSYFLDDDVEFVAELGGWYYTHDKEAGLNGSMIFRWHFYNDEKWTVFVDAGIGLLGTTDDVPARGTSFNFTPRVGVGFTRKLSDDGTRLLAGVRWAHISNARINGSDENPARDSADLFVGVIFPF